MFSFCWRTIGGKCGLRKGVNLLVFPNLLAKRNDCSSRFRKANLRLRAEHLTGCTANRSKAWSAETDTVRQAPARS